MRVTQAEMYRNFTSDIADINKGLNEVNAQISSGRKLNDLADSPAGSADLVSITDAALKVDMYRSNIDTSSYYLKSAESALNEVNNLVSSIYALGNQAATETLTSEVRATLASELHELREQMISLSNSQVDGRYLFAGSAVDSIPFVLAGDSVVYQGNGIVNEVPVSDGVQVRQGVPGTAAFEAVFSAIDALTFSLDADDIEGAKSSLEQFSGALAELGQARGQIGANLSLLESLSGVLDSQEALFTERKSRIEDADMVNATVRLSQLKTALDGALSAGGAILQQSNLFDILG